MVNNNNSTRWTCQKCAHSKWLISWWECTCWPSDPMTWCMKTSMLIMLLHGHHHGNVLSAGHWPCCPVNFPCWYSPSSQLKGIDVSLPTWESWQLFPPTEPGHCLDRGSGHCSLSNLLVVKYSNGWWRFIHFFPWFLLRHFWYLFPTSHRWPLRYWMAVFIPCLHWDQSYSSSTYHYIVLQNVSLYQIGSQVYKTSTSDGCEEERRCYSCIPIFCHCSHWLSLLVTNCCNQNHCIHSHQHIT